MNAIVFGSGGQDGYYLLNLLRSMDITVIDASRNSGTTLGNIADGQFVDNLINELRPNYIFHLAANSTTKHEALWDNHEAITTGTLNILESVKNHNPDSKVFISGSGLQFKNEGLPINETDELSHTSPYSITRNASLFAARYYRTLGLNVYFGFFYNHDSPRRTDRHISQKIASYCRNLRNEKKGLSLGNISVKKEWAFAGDIMVALWEFLNQEKYFEMNLGSGKAYSIQEWLELCFGTINEKWEDHVKLSSGFTPEYDTLVSNPERIFETGWRPKIQIDELANLMVNEKN